MQYSRFLLSALFKRTRHLITTLVMLVGSLLVVSIAWAHGTADQVNDPPGPSYLWCPESFPSHYLYQSFTPTADELAAVAVRIRSDPAGATIPIRIRTGSPSGAVLGESSAVVSGGLTHFDFDPPLALTPGNLYVIEVLSFNPGSDVLWAFTETNAYPDGNGWTCAALALEGFDLNFITYAPQSAPVASDDTYSANEDTVLAILAPGVLGNDSDADGDSLMAVLVSGPSNGTLTLNADGSFTYTPNANFFGTDSFTYKANDSIEDSNIATVQLNVLAVNDAPVAGDDTYSTVRNTTLDVAAPGVLANDADVDGDGLCGTWESGSPIDLNCDGSFTYTPAAGFSGTDSFSYQVCDSSGLCDTALVTLVVANNGEGSGPPSDPGDVVPDNPGNAGSHSNPRACEDNPGRANEHRPANVPPCR